MNEIGENLKRIRLLKNLSLKDAGNLLNMTATAISKYEKGEILPDSKKLIDFANAYNVKSIELLKVYNTPKMKFTSFRKKKRLSGKNFELLKQVINEKVSKYFEVKSLEEYEEDFISMIKFNCNNLNDAEQAALEFRNFIGISNRQPIIDLISILENLGILFVQIKNVNNLFDDFDSWFDAPVEKRFFGKKNPLYGKHAKNLMKTDVREKKDSYEVDIDLPGFKKDEIKLELENGYLTISAAKGLDKDETDKKTGKYIRRERYAGNLSRSFYIGDVKQEDVKAAFKNGILSITVPKEDKKAKEEKKYITIGE